MRRGQLFFVCMFAASVCTYECVPTKCFWINANGTVQAFQGMLKFNEQKMHMHETIRFFALLENDEIINVIYVEK